LLFGLAALVTLPSRALAPMIYLRWRGLHPIGSRAQKGDDFASCLCAAGIVDPTGRGHPRACHHRQLQGFLPKVFGRLLLHEIIDAYRGEARQRFRIEPNALAKFKRPAELSRYLYDRSGMKPAHIASRYLEPARAKPPIRACGRSPVAKNAATSTMVRRQ